MIAVVLIAALVVGLFWVWLRLEPMIGAPHLEQLERVHSSLAADQDKVVVCLGDSLTHGVASYDYVAELARRLEPWGYTVLNAGVNGDLAHNLVERIDAVTRIDPAWVVLLIGTNDARGTENERAGAAYVKRKALPQPPDAAFFESSYRAVLERIRDDCRARVLTLTIPMLGERTGEPIDAVVTGANAFIQRLSSESGHRNLPLHAVLRSHLPADPEQARPAYDGDATTKRVVAAVLRHRLLGWSWDRIACRSGMLLLTDTIHLSDQGGRLLVDLVEAAIRPESQTKSA